MKSRLLPLLLVGALLALGGCDVLDVLTSSSSLDDDEPRAAATPKPTPTPRTIAFQPRQWLGQATVLGNDLRFLRAAGAAAGTTLLAVGSSGTIARSEDGGTTWATPEAAPLAGDAVVDVALVDARTAFLASRRAVWRSADGGATWTKAWDFAEHNGADQPHFGLVGIRFFSAQVGLVGDGTAVWRTTDGGTSWRPEPVPGLDRLDAMTGVWAVDAQTVWIATARGLHRLAGGSWTALPAPTDPGALDALLSGRAQLVFTSAADGWALGARGGSGGAPLWRTADGGATWTDAAPRDATGERIPAANGGFDMGRMAFLPDGTGFVHTGGTMMRTNDGRAWAADKAFRFTGEVRDLVMPDGKNAWAAAGDGRILRFVDLQ